MGTHLVLDDGDALAVVLSQDVVQQRGFARAQEPSNHLHAKPLFGNPALYSDEYFARMQDHLQDAEGQRTDGRWPASDVLRPSLLISEVAVQRVGLNNGGSNPIADTIDPAQIHP